MNVSLWAGNFHSARLTKLSDDSSRGMVHFEFFPKVPAATYGEVEIRVSGSDEDRLAMLRAWAEAEGMALVAEVVLGVTA